MPYLLDANVFIEAKNRYYGLDFCPAFWEWLIEKNAARVVYSIENVGKELCNGRDDLSAWASVRGPEFFLPPPNPDMTAAMRRVSAWVMSKPHYSRAAVNAFLSGADFFLVAHALAEQHVVVTHEARAANSKKSVKIPDVCDGVGLVPRTPFEMLRNEGARFQLGPSGQAGNRPSGPIRPLKP